MQLQWKLLNTQAYYWAKQELPVIMLILTLLSSVDHHDTVTHKEKIESPIKDKNYIVMWQK